MNPVSLDNLDTSERIALVFLLVVVAHIGVRGIRFER